MKIFNINIQDFSKLKPKQLKFLYIIYRSPLETFLFVVLNVSISFLLYMKFKKLL